MKFTIEREKLIKPLQLVSAPLNSRPTLPILSNILLQLKDGKMHLTGTDLEIEIKAKIALTSFNEAGETTVPARKLLDICRGLPNDAAITFSLKDHRLSIQSGRSKFSLSTLPASDFPNLDDFQFKTEFNISHKKLRHLIDSVQFSMANQDVRYFLNGMLFEIENKTLKSVATDGHRLALCELQENDHDITDYKVIIPRKGVTELSKLISDSDENVHIQMGDNNIRVNLNEFTFTTKLIDGKFPDYRKVLPRNPDKVLESSCHELKNALSRAAILSNEKFKGVRLYIGDNQLKITANNPEQEESEEIIDVNYQGEPLEIGFNVTYLLDVLNAIKGNTVKILLTDARCSIQIEDFDDKSAVYVIMPMRL